MKKSILIIIAIGISFFIGKYIGEKAGEKNAIKKIENAEHKQILEKYIIIDNKGISHIEQHCIHLIKDNIGVEYKEIKLLKKEDLNKVCPFCIDAEKYENLLNTLKDSITTNERKIDVSKYFE